MKPQQGEHIVIICRNCKHRVRYHEAGQFKCIVEGCKCTEMDPIEEIRSDDQQNDIISIINENGKRVIKES